MEDIQRQIDDIKQRNKRVEADKARETSRTRKIIIIALTYIVIVIFLYTAKLPSPRLNAIVPSVAFLLSTLGFSYAKKLRLKHKK